MQWSSLFTRAATSTALDAIPRPAPLPDLRPCVVDGSHRFTMAFYYFTGFAWHSRQEKGGQASF